MKRSYKKLAVLAAAGVLVGAAPVYASIDMTSSAVDAETFASEIKIGGSGTALANPGNIMDANAKLGFGVSTSETRYVRVDLNSSATFVSDPTTLSVTDGVNTVTGVLASGGAGESFAIFSITDTSNAYASTASVNIVLDTDGITVMSNSTDVTMSYGLYETAGNAVNQTSALASDSEKVVIWGAALDITKGTVTPDDIDVTTSSTAFDAGGTDSDTATTEIGAVKIDVDGTTLWTDGTTAALSDIVTAASKLVVSGDFTACQDLTGGAPDGTYTAANVYIDNNGGCDNADVAADDLSGTAATFTIGTSALSTAQTICITTNGVSEISEGSYTGTYDLTASATSSAADQSIGTLSTLAKNGSSARLTFALTPNGAYKNYMRITNPSTVSGAVYITVTNDSGDSVDIELGDISGQTSTLATGASTSLIDINAVYDAAVAADATFDATGSKLRIDIDAEFGATNTTTGVVVNAVTVSKDGNSFVTMTDASN